VSEARSEILANIRRSLGVGGTEPERRLAVSVRLAGAAPGVIPARARAEGQERIARFKAEAEAAQASVAEVIADADVPAEVARFLRESNVPAKLRMGGDARLAAMPWGETLLEIAYGASDGHDLAAVSHAAGGAAETGTLMLTSGPDNPTTLNFLPDYHIVVIRAGDISGDLEGFWRALRATYGRGRMPRTVNLVTGPSRSGDIEQKLLLGAHGPRRLHVIIVNPRV
jgi:L-lactate dehydrogenase complex protein LldG